MMNDLDRPDHADALGRRAAAALRADVERRNGADGVDAALDRVQHGTGATLVSLAPVASPTRRLRSTWMGAAAAAAVVVVGTGAFLIARDDAGSRVVPADTSAPSPSPTTNDTTTNTDVSPDTTITDSTPATTLPDGPGPATTASADTLATTPALPATEVDALAGLVAPAPLDPSDPSLVPALLSSTPVADPSLVRLVEYATPIDAVTGLHQTWASPDGRILSISTELGRASSALDVTPIEVWPWDSGGLMNSMSSGVSLLMLSDPSGEVSLWGAGFTRDELVDIARTMRLTSEGWRFDATATADLVLLHEGWSRTSFATRILRWDDGGQQGEVLVNVGVPDTIRTPYSPGTAATLVDSINGAPALVTELPTGSAISWSPAPDVVVLIGISGTTDEVIALARSMTFVDVATWDAAGIADTSAADGCNSYFFC